MPQNKNTLKWRFDVNTFRLLGRDLITDRITALFELVKNAYDANATKVIITFNDIRVRKENSSITIQDNGIGMSITDIENKWMVIGTSSKRTQLYSPKPFNRRYIGEKGIGRFAVDKLGQYVRIKTKQTKDEQQLVVTINWETYENLANEQVQRPPSSLKLFTDIENSFEYTKAEFEQGTILEMLEPREIWDYKDVNRAEKELSRLVSPFHESKFPFDIYIHAPEYDGYTIPKRVETKEKEFASHSFKLEFNEVSQEQDYLHFDEKSQKLTIIKGQKPSFGFIKFYLYYFDQDAKGRFNAHYKDTEVHIDGVKIYRDGVLTTPFAEYESEDEKRRDVLGINKRRWRATFDRLGTREIIGFLEITREGNPQIIDATNRQEFSNTTEYRDLKDFLYTQLDVFMRTYKVERTERKQKNLDVFEESKSSLLSIQKEMTKLQKTTSEKKWRESTEKIFAEVTKLQTGVEAMTTVYEEEKQEGQRKEKMYFSLMSLSVFAANISHAVRTTIFSIQQDAYALKESNFNEVNEKRLKIYANRIYREIARLLKVVDFMLKYAQTNLPPEEFKVKEAIQTTFDAHETIFLEKGITIKLDLDENLSLFGNKIFFQDIITNLISNSIKATEGEFSKIIQCTAQTQQDKFVMLFYDNGIGIPNDKRNWVFELYNTTTQQQGGAGIGLYVVKTNVETFKGTAEVADNENGEHGTTIRLTIPFKK
jgi:signal transduction histidine kinase